MSALLIDAVLGGIRESFQLVINLYFCFSYVIAAKLDKQLRQDFIFLVEQLCFDQVRTELSKPVFNTLLPYLEGYDKIWDGLP